MTQEIPYRHILVPVDGSETSLAGLREALRLARPLGSTLRLFHVVNDLVLFGGLESTYYTDELLRSFRARGEDILRAAAEMARAAGVEAQMQSLESIGEPAGACIVAEARSWPADLIVLGTHGRRGVRRLVLGSDAEHVLRTTPVPILLVRGARSAT